MYRIIVICTLIACCFGFPEQTKWTNQPINFSSETKGFFHAVLANETQVRLNIECSQKNEQENPLIFEVKWLLRRSPCSGIYRIMQSDDAIKLLEDRKALFQNEEHSEILGSAVEETGSPTLFKCGQPVTLDNLSGVMPVKVNLPKLTEEGSWAGADAPLPVQPADEGKSEEKEDGRQTRHRRAPKEEINHHVIYKTHMAGPYLLLVQIRALNASEGEKAEAVASYDVEFYSPTGYLSALDYPMLSFSAVLCVVYAAFCVTWMVFGALQWRNLLRVQFWIGAVIGMGLLEQAVFLAEYEKMNSTGVLFHWAEMTAEAISILKKTLARGLVLIVSLGYGLIKPRLGSLMNNVCALCLCYFVFAVVETGLRIFQHRNDPSTKALIAAIPLSITESIICWWVFTSLMTTLKNLKLRRNIVKLTVYRHFFNTLIFCVIAAVIFMLWSIRVHKMPNCVTDWRELWIDDAYWQLLFVVILFVIIILWRPSQNNKRYAFSPLMDDELDEEQEEPFIDPENSNFDQVKIRKNVSNLEKNLPRTVDKSEDDNLKWVEDNIPASGFDTALPSLLDSDEEVMTTKLEMSKQQ